MSAVPNDEELFRRVREAITEGWTDIPDKPGYGGTGGPGRVLEDKLGVSGGNLDIPDAGKWEIKFHSKNALLTLFHLEGKPKGHMHDMVRLFGIKDANGRLSFRHTIKGKSDRGFYVANDAGKITVRNDGPDDFVWPYWKHDTLINAFVSKLRRVIVVKGSKKKLFVRFESAYAFEEPRTTLFIDAIEQGVVAIDFDARTTDSDALRNHGTKFRVHYEDLARLYHKKHRIE